MALQLALERGYEDQVYKFCAVLWESKYKCKKPESETSYFREIKELSNLEKLE